MLITISFTPKKVNKDIDVLYHGSYQPLHGIEYIVNAAAKLKDIHFEFVGQGQDKKKALKLIEKLNIKNIGIKDWMLPTRMNLYINKSKIVLGTFGKSPKARSVLTNKLFEGLACKKVVISSDTLAHREFLTHQENCYLVKAGNSQEISKAIKLLLKNKKLRQKIAENGYHLYIKNFLPEKVVRQLLNYI